MTTIKMPEMIKEVPSEKNDITEIVFILDKSGSMSGMESDTIGGFNSVIKSQKEKKGRAYVTTVLFDNTAETLHDRIPLGEVKKMTSKDYRVGGCTALIDAIGGTVEHIETIHKYSRPEDVPSNTVFIITTDGYENASTKYSAEKVRKLIEAKKEAGWEFIFMAANIDAVETARNMGIKAENAVNFHNDPAGARATYAAMDMAVAEIREEGAIKCKKWRKAVDEDYENRK